MAKLPCSTHISYLIHRFTDIFLESFVAGDNIFFIHDKAFRTDFIRTDLVVLISWVKIIF